MTLRTVAWVATCCLVLDADDLVGRRSLAREPPVEPLERGRDRGVLLAQPLGELDGEGRARTAAARASASSARRRPASARRRCRGARRRSRRPGPARCPARRRARPGAGGSRRGRRRSEIASAHSSPIVRRLDALVGADEARERLELDPAVGVRDERPGQAVDARIALERLRRRAWAARGRTPAAGPPGSRGSAPRRCGSCSAATRPPARSCGSGGWPPRSPGATGRGLAAFSRRRGSSRRPRLFPGWTSCSAASVPANCSSCSVEKSSARIGLRRPLALALFLPRARKRGPRAGQVGFPERCNPSRKATRARERVDALALAKTLQVSPCETSRPWPPETAISLLPAVLAVHGHWCGRLHGRREQSQR